MKKWISLSALGLLIVFIGCMAPQKAEGVPRTSKEDLKAALGSPDVMIIDVRTGKDWAASTEKIAGAVRMEAEAFDAWSATLPKGKRIILYCA